MHYTPRILAALLGLLLLTSSGCGGGPESGGEVSDEGRIREIDVSNRTLVMRHRRPTDNPNETLHVYRTYRVAYDCRITTADKPEAELTDLQEDDKMDVRYVQDGQDFILYRIKPD